MIQGFANSRRHLTPSAMISPCKWPAMAKAPTAHRIAMSIANSPLVKTAIAGEDANWGRIVMAIGKAGEKAKRDKLRIRIGGIQVAAKGMRDPGYKEAEIMPHMKGRHITIEADVGVAQGKARVWTCDLTHGYIDINGSYRS
jgi:glutamate N-acetyltransferase / amino-acid N-acetyltransferase